MAFVGMLAFQPLTPVFRVVLSSSETVNEKSGISEVESCELCVQDVNMDVSSAAALQASLAALRNHPDPRMLDIVQLLATKPMQVRQPSRAHKGPSALPLLFPCFPVGV